MNWLIAAKNFLFGSSDRGVVDQLSDAVDKWSPSATTIHKQSIEDLKAGDDSQKSAREMQLKSHDGAIDVVVDALNRLVRPLVTFWVIGGLFGFWQMKSPSTDPMMMNIIWTVLTFWFGSRVIFKDLPTLIRAMRK